MKHAKKGFTIVEVVIAVLIAVAVSISALSVVIATRSSSKEAFRQYEANSFTAAMLECYKTAETVDKFKENIGFAFGEIIAPVTDRIDPADVRLSHYYNTKVYLYFDKTNALATTEVTSTTDTEYSYVMVVEINSRNLNKLENSTMNIHVYGQADEGDARYTPGLLVYELEKPYIRGTAPAIEG